MNAIGKFNYLYAKSFDKDGDGSVFSHSWL